jgi:small subunit ribosomal protein S20
VAHSISAKKRIRQNLKARARNRYRKELIKNQIKSFTIALGKGDASAAAEELKKVTSRLDKVAAKHTIHKNAAARKRSRLTKRLNAMVAAQKASPGGAATTTTRKGKGTKAAKA